ncbi:MAG: hypothetical protein WD669_09925 [Pirellulales bacterium]
MFAQHSEKRSRVLLAAAIGSGLVWSAAGMPLSVLAKQPDPVAKEMGAVVQPVAGSVSVASMSVSWTYAGGSKKRPDATVWLEDNEGNPVSGATVTGKFTGCYTETGLKGKTDAAGKIRIFSKKTYAKCIQKPCYFYFTVTSVTHPALTWVPGSSDTGQSPCRPFNTSSR